MIHKLTTKEREDLLKYSELISSEDEESMKLGISLFYEEYKHVGLPDPVNVVGYYHLCNPNNLIKLFDLIGFCKNQDDLKIFVQNHWTRIIEDLLEYNFYDEV